MKRTTAVFPVLLLCIIVFTGCYTQLVPLGKNQTSYLQDEVRKLAKSTLVVRLYTNNPKRRLLQEYSQGNALAKHDEDRANYASTLISTWEEHYSFSEVVYIPDSLFLAFQDGSKRPLFLNGDLELDPSIKIETEDHYILARGSRDYAFTWLNADLEPLLPQPPINYDKLSLWELLQGRDKVLADRVISTDAYFKQLAL
jgi:hypothetical protein